MSGDEGTMSSFVYCFVELFVVFLCLPIPFLPQNDPIFIGPRYLGIINFWTFPVQVDKNGDHVENAGISYKIHPSFKFSYVKPNTPEIHLFPQKYCNLCTWFDCPAPDHPGKICTFYLTFDMTPGIIVSLTVFRTCQSDPKSFPNVLDISRCSFRSIFWWNQIV